MVVTGSALAGLPAGLRYGLSVSRGLNALGQDGGTEMKSQTSISPLLTFGGSI